VAETLFLTLAEAIEVHADQIHRYGGQAGLRDLALLESALAQPEASFAGEWLHREHYEMAAAYAYHLCQNHPFQNHPFIDGNKRTALAAALVFLELNGITISDPRGRLKTVMGKMSKVDFAKVLRKLPRPK